MKRSDETNRAEPSDMSWVQTFPDYARLFLEAGWLSFSDRIDGYHIEVSYKFSQCLDKDIVFSKKDKDIVTFDTLNIELTRELIVEATGILDKVNIGSKKYLLPLMHIITYFKMWLHTWVKEYISINLN